MIADSLQLHRAAIAYVHANASPLIREDNLAFYDEVTRSGEDYPEMLQGPSELGLTRRTGSPQGSQFAEVRVGHMHAQVPGVQTQVPAGFRLLVAEQGSGRPYKFFVDRSESVYSSFRNIWGSKVGKLSLVEVSLVATLAREKGDVAKFLQDNVLRTGPIVQSHLGREYDQITVKYGSGIAINAGPAAPVRPLPDSQVDFSLETHAQDPRLLVITLIVKWQSLNLRISELGLPEAAMKAVGGRKFIDLNNTPDSPAKYLDAVYDYLEHQVVPFLAAADL